MRFNLSIYADTPDELRDALAALIGSIPASAFPHSARGFNTSARGFKIEALPDHSGLPGYSLGPVAPTVLPAPPSLSSSMGPETPPPAPAKRTRRTAAQIEADKTAAGSTTTDDTTGTGTGTDPEADDAAFNPFLDDDDDDDDTPVVTDISPADAKLQALEKLRQIYAGPGGPGIIKIVQKEFGVSKFIDVPDSRGIELYERATAIEDQNAKAKAA